MIVAIAGPTVARATIATLARAAEVSTATVDRVLNGRPGVSAANRQRVLAAARALGYLASEGMVALPARPAHLAFLIPQGTNAFMRDLAEAIAGFAASLPLVAECRLIAPEGIGPDALARSLDALPGRTEGVGVVTTDHPRSRALLDQLCEGGVRVVAVASDVGAARKSAYVGVDNRAAGRTAAQLVAMMTGAYARSHAGGAPPFGDGSGAPPDGDGSGAPPDGDGARGSVALFLGSRDYHGHSEREQGFLAGMAERCPGLEVLPAIETGGARRPGRDGDAPPAGRSARPPRRLLRRRRPERHRAGDPGGPAHPPLRGDARPDRWRPGLARGRPDRCRHRPERAPGGRAGGHPAARGHRGRVRPDTRARDIEPRIVLRENLPR